MSCLFNSLTVLLKPELEQQKINNLRTAVVNYLEANPDIKIADTSLKEWIEMIKLTESNPHYLQTMRCSSTWGGAMEIIAVAQMFQVRIHVLRHGQPVAVFKPADGPVKAELLLNWSGAHYTPLKRLASNN